MMSNRQISENFEVQINTLYNWRKTKPRLYAYLRNADYNFDMSKEINVLLGRLAQDIHATFAPNEILEIVTSKLEAKTLNDIEIIERMFIREHAKRLPKEGEYLLGIYNKLHALSLLEKYIFYKRIYNVRSESKDPDLSHVREFFDVFIA